MKGYWIHPAIGLARVGESDEYYLTPETPGEIANEGNSYRDQTGRIKKQGQRFRIYEYEHGSPIREITASDAQIKWHVQLANHKAALRKAHGPALPRNVGVPVRDLIIDSRTQDVSPAGRRVLEGEFRLRNKKVVLGAAIADDDGRLTVLGGYGQSDGPVPRSGTDLHFANNDGWYDDTSDGVVSATVTFDGGTPIQTTMNARVLCGPPGFAPGIENVVTLYDAVFQAAIELDNSLWPPERLPTFHDDILPLLRRTVGLSWVSAIAQYGHGTTRPGQFTDQNHIMVLSDNDSSPTSNAYQRRRTVFLRMRTPNNSAPPTIYREDPNLRPSQRDMPKLNDGFSVTPHMYELMRQWSLGRFTTGIPSTSGPVDTLPVAEQPAALDRAALEGATGGPWYPGIETWNVLTDPVTFDTPFRVKDAIPVGHLTIGNALPWQADFQACGTGWWPSQRPNEVRRLVNGQRMTHYWVTWNSNHAMVNRWRELGFIVRVGDEYMQLEPE